MSSRRQSRHLPKTPARFKGLFKRWRFLVSLKLNERRWAASADEQRRQYIDKYLNIDNHYWLFILGANNSGTTMLYQLLKTHPQVRSLPSEGHRVTRALPRPEGMGRIWGTQIDKFRMTEDSDPAPALRAMYDWVHCLDRRSGVILEKSPPNVVRGRWLQKHFQPNKFIGITRHPFAVCEGTRRRVNCTIETAAHHWANVHKCLLEDEKHLQNYLRISYEGLCDWPEQTLEQIEQLLQLPTGYDRSILTRQYKVHNVESKPVEGVKNFNPKSFDRLSAEDRDTILRIAGPTMEQFGYTATSPTLPAPDLSSPVATS